ncbi:MAG: Rv3654c family TadE-like protein [Mycobacteriaceae bacterium]
MNRVNDDRGAATVLAAIMVAVLITVTLAGVRLGSAVVARHRAQSVADLAALAGAARIPAGSTAACREARALADAMRATVQACNVEQLDIAVSVAVAVGGWAGAQASARARAGPGES